MGCRCGQKQQLAQGAATYSAPAMPPSMDNFGSPMQASVGVWYVVVTEDGPHTFDSMDAAVAFADGEYPITRTSAPPQPVV